MLTQKLDSAPVGIASLLLSLGIQEWDYLLIGDGSGTTWQNNIGWCSSLFSKDNEINHFFGGQNSGTNIIAEMLAYVAPLLWLKEQHKKTSLSVHIITDCELISQQGNNITQRKSHKELWNLFDAIVRNGIFLTWHWYRRDQLDLNKLSHEKANEMRRLLIQSDTCIWE